MIHFARLTRFVGRSNIASNSQVLRGVSTVSVENANSNHVPPTEAAKRENPLEHHDYFGVRKCFTMDEMFNARVYLGHKEGTLNPFMKPYLLGTRLGHLIFDLNQTRELLGDALNFMAHVAYNDGVILFIDRSRQNGHLTEKLAKEAGEFAHTHTWVANTFLDSSNFFSTVTRLPDLVIFLNTFDNVFDQHPAVVEAAKMLIPTIGVVDSPADPRLISYPVPGNDDSPASIDFYCRVFKHAILAGKTKAKQFEGEQTSSS